MTDHFQPGHHPGADVLSAFAEDALPAHERQQTLAHLADCEHCRTIVSLALPPIEAEPQPQFIPVRRPWFASWKLALPTLGFAAAAILVFAVHRHYAASTDKTVALAELANNAPKPGVTTPPPPGSIGSTSGTPSQAAAPPPPAKTAAPQATLPVIAQPMLRPPVSIPADSMAAASSGSANATLDNFKVQDLPVNGRDTVAARQSFGGAPAGAALPQSALAQPAAVATAPAPIAPAPPPSPALNGSISAEVMADTATIATGVASPLHALPSRRAILSTITRNNQTLALDTAGALFVSLDSGQHWKPVPTQWQGRAVKLTLATYPPPLLTSRAGADNYAAKPAAMGGPLGTDPASITGTLTDPTGASIGGASILLKDSSAKLLRSIETNSSGAYTLEGLAPGAYQLEASSPGFVESRTVTTLAAGQRLPLNLTLTVGAASETVSVTSQTSILENRSVARKRSMAGPSAKAEPSPPPVAPLFELTTEGGERWSSPDGQTWRRN